MMEKRERSEKQRERERVKSGQRDKGRASWREMEKRRTKEREE